MTRLDGPELSSVKITWDEARIVAQYHRQEAIRLQNEAKEHEAKAVQIEEAITPKTVCIMGGRM